VSQGKEENYMPHVKKVPHLTPLAFMAITVVISAAFTLGLVAMLSWQACLMLMLVAAALAGGAIFTIQEMQSLGRDVPQIGRSGAKIR
jgi:hypothetical protein